MNEYFSKLRTLGKHVKVELDLFNYATKLGSKKRNRC